MLDWLPPQITVGSEPSEPEHRAAVSGLRALHPENSVAQSREVQMMRALGLTVLGALVVGVSSVMAVGWAYEGPRRFIRRVKLRRAVLEVDKLRGQR